MMGAPGMKSAVLPQRSTLSAVAVRFMIRYHSQLSEDGRRCYGVFGALGGALQSGRRS